MGGYDNSLAVDFTKKRKKAGMINAKKSGELYQEYLNHPTAQYQMTFLQYKKNRKKILSDGPDQVSTGQRVEMQTIRQE